MTTILKKSIAVAAAIAVMAVYVPVTGSTAFASAKFSTKQSVKNLTKVSASYDRIRIKWSTQTGAKGYQVYRSDGAKGKFSRITSVKSDSYINRCLSLDGRYYYKVRAYAKKSGKTVYGRFSNVLSASPQLNAPEGFSAKAAGSTSVSLQWNRVAGAKYYDIFRFDASGKKYSCKSYDASFTDSGLSPDTTYYYKVRACADVNGKTFMSSFAGGETREIVLDKALSWFGLMEYDKSNQPIIDIYNQYFYDTFGRHTGYDYTIPWCAIYVSAVSIETDTEDLIPVHEDCPDMMELFEKTVGKPDVNSYIPAPADVVFYDWISSETGKRNGRADHVGIIVSATSDEITAVEGNKTIRLASGEETDAVAYRVYTPDFDSLLAYGLPQYPETKATTGSDSDSNATSPADSYARAASDSTMLQSQGKETAGITTESNGSGSNNEETIENPVPDADVEAAVKAVEGLTECRGTGTSAAASADADSAKADALVEYIQNEHPADKSSAEESTYNAYLIMHACNEMGIDACAVINADRDGNEISWAEVTIGGETFIVDSSGRRSL